MAAMRAVRDQLEQSTTYAHHPKSAVLCPVLQLSLQDQIKRQFQGVRRGAQQVLASLASETTLCVRACAESVRL